jgi:hypothetical protein
MCAGLSSPSSPGIADARPPLHRPYRSLPTLNQEGAFVDVVVKLGLIKLIQKRFSLCDELYV